jgi:DNA-binding CsgD family transcriptional regulator
MVATREWVSVDGVTAVALAVAAQVEIWSPRLLPGVGQVAGERPVLAVTAVVATLPLALRRRYPLVVLVLVLGAQALQQVLTTPTQGLVLLLAGMVAAYSSSAFPSSRLSSRRQAAVAVAVVGGGAALTGEDGGDVAFLALVLGAAWLGGLVVRQHSADLSRVREDNRALSVRLAVAVEQLTRAQRPVVPSPSPDALAGLTARELEVTRAIAAGMTNAEIAAALSISEWTVKTHVASVLRKLALRDRAQVVVAAYESGLVVPNASAD